MVHRIKVSAGRESAISVLLLFLVVGVAGAWFLRPQTALAQSDDEGLKPCVSCHSDEEDAWKVSPHARTIDPVTGLASAVCEACHGDYVRGHPDEAMEPLRVDSAICKGCHPSTYEQWQQSIHGDEGVQCISCHLPHSQQVRLTDEQQCKACHQESLTDPLHTAHWQSETSCTDCHMASTLIGAALAAANPELAAMAVPSHDFVSVSADNCLECHREDVSSQSLPPDTVEIAHQEAIEKAPALSANLKSARADNRALSILTVVNLGFGIGLGGILGIVFMVVFIRMSRRGE